MFYCFYFFPCFSVVFSYLFVSISEKVEMLVSASFFCFCSVFYMSRSYTFTACSALFA